MKILSFLIAIAIFFNLSAQKESTSLQESLNKALKTEEVKKEDNSLQASLNNALKTEAIQRNNLEANVDLSQNAIQLKWENFPKSDITSFIIEKSIDKLSWEEVATVYGAPHKSQSTEFFHIDYTPSNNLSFYRLKSKNKNGKENTSNIVPVNYIKKEGATAGMNLNPNFSEDYKIINIAFEEVFEKEILVVIRDKKGNEFYSKIIVNVEDQSLIAVPLETTIPKGEYLITATSENQIYSQNITVL